MLRLETLGRLALTDSSGHAVIDQRRRLALLALLASAGERGMSRDKLVAVLWPESASDSARHALEQLLYSLRRQTPEPVIAGTDPLRLDPAVEVDLTDFTRCLAAGDHAGAVAVYRGPFLDGFFLTGATEFERWSDGQRARLAAEHARALRALAAQAEAGGRHTAEIDYWRLLAAADPLGERAANELVRALMTAGDWVGAARAAREYATRVRDELPGAPGSDLVALVDRLHREHRAQTTGTGIPPESTASTGRYDIERELGRGSTAVVYLARDRRFDRPVALKLLRPELATATDARRFRREIGVLAQLYHPHILQLYDSGVMPPEADHPGLFYVMPYVRGETLRQRLRREVQLDIGQALTIAGDIAEALEYAHGQGVVHRDIRPENILLESGHALVSDFGIVSVLETAGGEQLSVSGVALGHPGYSSPEQAMGEGPPDGRSDIYSLGCVLYEMLAGEPPFTGATATAVLARQLSDEVRPIRTVRAEVPRELEQAVMRALAKRPEERFSTAGEFREALRRRN
jgi:serine/threonine-protein kinase